MHHSLSGPFTGGIGTLKPEFSDLRFMSILANLLVRMRTLRIILGLSTLTLTLFIIDIVILYVQLFHTFVLIVLAISLLSLCSLRFNVCAGYVLFFARHLLAALSSRFLLIVLVGRVLLCQLYRPRLFNILVVSLCFFIIANLPFF